MPCTNRLFLELSSPVHSVVSQTGCRQSPRGTELHGMAVRAYDLSVNSSTVESADEGLQARHKLEIQ